MVKMKKSLILLFSLSLFGGEMKISENKYFLQPKEKLILSVIGGEAKYSWNSQKGDIIYFDKNHSKVTYQAPRTYGIDIVNVYDSTGEKVSKEFKIIMPLAITPKIRYIKDKNIVKYKLIGGSGEYICKVKNGKCEIEIDKLIYHSDGNSTKIEIIDKITKEKTEAFIKVINKLEIETGDLK